MLGVITLFIFVVPVMLGVFLLKKKRKLAYILISFPFLAIFIGLGLWMYHMNHQFTADTDLAGERFTDLALLQPLTEDDKQRLGSYAEEENVIYDELLHFSQLTIGTNVNKEITYINSEAQTRPTTKGITVGDSLEEVKKIYGDDYYTVTESGSGEAINYVDRKAKIHLQFWHNDGKVIAIRLLQI